MIRSLRKSSVICVVACVLVALGLTGPASAKAKGTPIKIGIIYSVAPGVDSSSALQGAQAAASYLNSTKGFNGQPVEIVSCDDKGDPATDAACAKQFVDAGVVAIAGLSAVWGANGLPATPSIPSIASPTSNAEFLGANSYPTFGGSLATFEAMTKYTLAKGIKTASVIYTNIAAGKLAADALLTAPLTAAGVKVTGVGLDIGAADVTPAVVQANAGNPDAIFLVISGADVNRILKSAAQVGVTSKVYAPSPAVEVIAGVPANMVKQTYFTVTTAFFDKKSKEAKIYTDSMSKYNKKPVISDFSAAAFANVMTLQTIVKPMGATITADAIMAAVKAPAGIPVFMATELNAANAAKIATIPTHVFNAGVRIVQFDSKGTLVDANNNQWVNGAVTP